MTLFKLRHTCTQNDAHTSVNICMYVHILNMLINAYILVKYNCVINNNPSFYSIIYCDYFSCYYTSLSYPNLPDGNSFC